MNKRVFPCLLSARLLFVVLTVLAATATATAAIGAQSTTGAKGATGIPDTSNVVTNWNPAVTYKAGQVVYCAACSTNGSKYIALIDNVNVDPPGNLNVIWQLVTSAGANGANGNTGATGSTGEPAPSSATPPPPSSPPGRMLL